MGDFSKAYEKFLYRDLPFVLGGSMVLGSGLYAFGRFPKGELPVYQYFMGAGAAYAVGYAIQEALTLAHVVRTKAGMPTTTLGAMLYRLFDRRAAEPVDPVEYRRAKLWLYEQGALRFRDDHERIESLKKIGTILGPCFSLAAAILVARNQLAGTLVTLSRFELVVSAASAALGIVLWLLGWLKVTQQSQYLIGWYRAAQEPRDTSAVARLVEPEPSTAIKSSPESRGSPSELPNPRLHPTAAPTARQEKSGHH